MIHLVSEQEAHMQHSVLKAIKNLQLETNACIHNTYTTDTNIE